MNWDFLILGSSGIQGRIVSRELLENGYNLFLTDLYREGSDELIKLYPQPKTGFQTLDVRNKDETIALIQQIQPQVVINCAEGDYNDKVYEACLATKTNVIDLGSDIKPTASQLKFHEEFKKSEIIGITGCGSTPGINNVMLRYGARDFDTIDTIDAGFAWDSNMKIFLPPFSIGSIIYELIFPAPYIENGVWKKINNPLKKSKNRKFKKIGTQECFIVDHPETFTFEHCYKNKGLKNVHFFASFPKHSLKIIKMFIELGLSSEDDVLVENLKNLVEISPLDVLTQVLKRIRHPKKYKETEILWVSIYGKKDDKKITVKMECLVETLKKWETAGCNIDTGITAAIIARMIKNGEISDYGSFVPEQIIPEKLFFNHLNRYGMKIFKNGLIINAT